MAEGKWDKSVAVATRDNGAGYLALLLSPFFGQQPIESKGFTYSLAVFFSPFRVSGPRKQKVLRTFLLFLSPLLVSGPWNQKRDLVLSNPYSLLYWSAALCVRGLHIQFHSQFPFMVRGLWKQIVLQGDLPSLTRFEAHSFWSPP